jgi:hypothetical protein
MIISRIICYKLRPVPISENYTSIIYNFEVTQQNSEEMVTDPCSGSPFMFPHASHVRQDTHAEVLFSYTNKEVCLFIFSFVYDIMKAWSSTISSEQWFPNFITPKTLLRNSEYANYHLKLHMHIYMHVCVWGGGAQAHACAHTHTHT